MAIRNLPVMSDVWKYKENGCFDSSSSQRYDNVNVHVDRLVDLVQCLGRVISYFGVDLTEVGTGYWVLGNG